MSTSGKPLADAPGAAPDGRPVPAGRWSAEPPAPPPAARRPRGAEREVKGLFAVGAPPPPVGASIPPGAADPIASLFSSDTVVRTPGINDAPSEAELGRWRATMQSSLFEERVVDPVPPARVTPPPPPARAMQTPPPPPVRRVEAPQEEAPVASAPPAPASTPAPVPALDPSALELAIALEPEPRRVAALQAPVPLPAPVRSKQAKKKKQKGGEPTLPEVAELAAVDAEEAAPAPSRRRFERGPSRALLVALGIAALAAVAALVIVLGPWPGSSATPAGDVVARLPTPAAAPAPVAAPAPAPAAAPAAPTPTATAPEPPSVPAPAASPAEPAQAAAVRPEPAAPADPKPEAPEAAAPESPAPAPASQPAVQPAAAVAAPEAEEAPEGMLRDARKALEEDNAVAAEGIARQALAKAPQDHHAMELLALALIDQDRGQEALPLARRIVARRPKRVPYRLVLGDVLLMVGDEPGARAEWQKALELSPKDKAIKRRLGLP